MATVGKKGLLLIHRALRLRYKNVTHITLYLIWRKLQRFYRASYLNKPYGSAAIWLSSFMGNMNKILILEISLSFTIHLSNISSVKIYDCGVLTLKFITSTDGMQSMLFIIMFSFFQYQIGNTRLCYLCGDSFIPLAMNRRRNCLTSSQEATG